MEEKDKAKELILLFNGNIDHAIKHVETLILEFKRTPASWFEADAVYSFWEDVRDILLN